MESLELTDPIVTAPKVTDTYRVTALTLDWLAHAELVPPVAAGGTAGKPGLVTIRVVDNHGVDSTFQYVGAEAADMIKWMNTANFSTHSMHKRLLQRLSKDGYLPGTVTGAPDTPPVRDEL